MERSMVLAAILSDAFNLLKMMLPMIFIGFLLANALIKSRYIEPIKPPI